MRHLGLALLALSTFALGQATDQQSQHDVRKIPATSLGISSPTANDMYCSGFITTEKVPDTSYVVGGLYSPDQAHFAGATDRVFIYGAANIKAGDRLHILRHVKDPNHYERYKGEKSAIRSAGEAYFERGYVRVIEVQKNVAIAIPELSCADIVPGDLAIPFVPRETPHLKAVTLDRFAPPSGKPAGRIVMAEEFDSYLGTPQKVFLSIGSDKGLKVGDYLRATRTYEYMEHDADFGLSAKAREVEETQMKPPKFPKNKLGELPRKTVGDMIVLHVHPRSATAMIITAFEEVRVGDIVEVMDTDGAPEASTTAPTPH